MKPLMPSLKEKKRYIVFETNAKKSLEKIRQSILNEYEKLFGKIGISQAGIMFLKDYKNSRGIVRINRKYVDHLKSSFVTQKDFQIYTVGVSGILKKARSKFMGG